MLVIEVLNHLQNLTQKHISQAEFARVLDVSPVSINKRIVRNSEIKVSEIELLEKHYGVNLISSSAGDCIEIDHIHINPSCGSGTVVLEDAEVTPIKLGTQLIETVLKVSHPNNLKTFKASGDSMESIIEDGDLLLVDTGRTDFNNGGVFLLTINNDWFIKRLRKRLSGELDVISDNTKYPVETFKPDDDIEIIVKGRVVKNLSRGL